MSTSLQRWTVPSWAHHPNRIPRFQCLMMHSFVRNRSAHTGPEWGPSQEDTPVQTFYIGLPLNVEPRHCLASQTGKYTFMNCGYPRSCETRFALDERKFIRQSFRLPTGKTMLVKRRRNIPQYKSLSRKPSEGQAQWEVSGGSSAGTSPGSNSQAHIVGPSRSTRSEQVGSIVPNGQILPKKLQKDISYIERNSEDEAMMLRMLRRVTKRAFPSDVETFVAALVRLV